ncbi:DUF6452 family protein [Flavobacterium chungbukense]|uniref:DUF6452 family protein n=1 Tax=Flavobacterium chungbukense TaxID=877464 RepID=A0ABP7XRM7_9FLAO|nr:DUF6452 family protein [Flavobacterium chungbukense]MCC4921204.1 DUF6452 family protein [Flavobacterium chungbukense]
MKKLVSLLLLFTFGLSSCEKDDICDSNTPTTPRLVITFYDNADPTVLRKISNLTAIGEGKDAETGLTFSAVSKIELPLKVNDTITTYKLIYNAASTIPADRNTDVLTINYTTQNVYVSRACGFKTIFTVSSITRTDPDGDTVWMSKVQLINPNIDSENETHVEVYF